MDFDFLEDRIDAIKELIKDHPFSLLCYGTLLYSSLVALIGFSSIVTMTYLGDILIRSLLLVLFLLIFILIVYSYFVLHQKKKLLVMSIIAGFVILSMIFIPLLPPEYGLRQFDIDASLLKFLATSIILVILGVACGSLSFQPLYHFKSKASEKSAYYILLVSILLVLYPLAIIMGNIIVNGVGGITWEFLTEDVRRLGTEGGIFPALIGTLLIMIGTALVALPLGIGCAIYLQEYAKKGILVRIISICVDILQGTPSIVHGLFGLAFFVPLFGISLLSGALIMGFLTLPIIIRASEEALRSVPQNIREGSYAVGATKWQTIRKVVLPPALPSIITGSVLGLGRAAGETAPIMFTAVYFIGAGIPQNPLQPIQALPYHLLELTRLIGYKSVDQNAWATAFLLLAIVLGVNALAIIIREKYRVEF